MYAQRFAQELKLARNQLGEPGAKDLSMGLRCSWTLRRLDISGNKLNAVAMKAIASALCSSPSSTTDIQGVGDEGEQGKSSHPPLEFLDVSRNPLGDEGGAALLLTLAVGRGASMTLRVLKMAEAGLGGETAAALAVALSSPGVLSADVDVTGEGEERPDAQSGAARGLPQLRTLDLSKNKLGPLGVTGLAGALSKGGASLLETLSMGYNEVGDEGAMALGRSAGKGLKILDLSGNSLSGEGMRAVLSVPGLKEARLFYNVCGDDGEVIQIGFIVNHCYFGMFVCRGGLLRVFVRPS